MLQRARWIVAVLVVAALTAPAAASGVAKLKPVDFKPLSSAEAARKVERNGFEPRPKNKTENKSVPSRKQLKAWKAKKYSPYSDLVNGRFTGTTDEIIQWAAYKWGLPEDVVRAAAVIESYWDMDVVGDNGDSFGLLQIRRPYHCNGDCAIAHDHTAFNADYYGAIIRAYYDGKMPWLNDVERGRDYRKGDLWGSIGAWFAGRWRTPPAEQYIRRVQEAKAKRTWKTPEFEAADR